jgi:hypothetical protein
VAATTTCLRPSGSREPGRNLRYRLSKLHECEHDVTGEERLDTETVGRLFLALDWFETRGQSIVDESRTALAILPVTSTLEEVPQGA